MTNQDFRDLFSAFNDHEVRYLIVGAYAVTYYSRPRFTKDLDVWIEPQAANAEKAWNALITFGAPLQGVGPKDLATPGVVLQIGVEPNRIDILTQIQGVKFKEAWARRVSGKYGDCPVCFLSREDLIVNKEAVGRPQDLLDLEALKSLPGGRENKP